MKNLNLFILAIATIALFGTGCQREVIQTEASQADLSAHILNGTQTPTNLCATPTQLNLIDDGGTIVGTLEVSNNNQDELYLSTRFTHGWLMTDIMFFVGDRNDIPKGDSKIELEELPFQFHLQSPKMSTEIRVPIGNQAPCFDISVWFRAYQYDFFGNPISEIEGWANGTSILNGFYSSFCPTPCASANNNNSSN